MDTAHGCVSPDVLWRLADADRMMSLGRLVAGIAHEINNPSSFITINVHVLKDLYTGLIAELDTRYSEQGCFPVGGLMYSQARTDISHLLEGVETGAHRIVVPPLRLRREDILLIASHFLAEFARKLGVPAPAMPHAFLASLENQPLECARVALDDARCRYQKEDGQTGVCR